jgi:LPXTG-motif cell wall-anchored protein
MNAPARLLLALAFTLAAAASAPSAAAADGLPANGVDAAPVSAPGGSVEYLTRRATRRRATLVVARERGGERILGRLRLAGSFAVPAVAYDGSAGGLSADGTTLILIRPRSGFPRSDTTLAVLDAKRLRPRRVLRLRGDFSFDAVSPRGELMYLIQYLSPRNPNRYAVRAYDLRARRLLPEPVVDPREASEPMNGTPITRATSPDGRWAYTLYDSAEHPFIHALDTERRRAVCIDLLSLASRKRGIWGLRLDVGPGGSPLTVEAGSRVLASVDTRTFDVSEAGADRRASAPRSGGGTSWWFAAAGLLLLTAVGVLAGRRRRWSRRRSGPEHFDPMGSHGPARSGSARGFSASRNARRAGTAPIQAEPGRGGVGRAPEAALPERRHAAASSARWAMRPAAPSSAPAESNVAVAPPTSRPVRPRPRRSDTDAESSAPPSEGAKS